MNGEENMKEMPGKDVRSEVDTMARPLMSSLEEKHELMNVPKNLMLSSITKEKPSHDRPL